MNRLKVKLTGIAPLLLHNERLANPMDPHVRAMKQIATQRKKTEEQLLQIAELEWRLGIYEELGRPVMPADNILATVKNGARKRRLGKQVEAGVFCERKNFLLEYDGPKTVDELWQDKRFFDYRSVAVDGKRVMRARPIFQEWSINAELIFDSDLIQEADLLDACEIGGMLVGLCEKRPQFGRFAVEKVS